MSEIDRRHVVGALLAGGAAVVAQRTEAAPVELAIKDLKKDADAACVYHCDFGDPARFSQQLRNISNHMAIYNLDP